MMFSHAIVSSPRLGTDHLKMQSHSSSAFTVSRNIRLLAKITDRRSVAVVSQQLLACKSCVQRNTPDVK